MKKLLKFFAVLIILVLLALVGLAVFVNTYFTDERVRTMLLPPMEQALGRSVEIGHIDVSLFTGINVYDVTIKEENGVDNFFSSNRFVLSYDLVPLLNKQVVIHEVRLVAPLIKLHRNKDGIFNFSSLAFLATKKETPATPVQSPATLPFSITVDKMVIENGKMVIADATEAIPASTISADITIGLGLQQGLADITFQGDSDFSIETSYHGIKPLCGGKISFSKSRIAYSIDMAVDEDQVNLSGSLENYLDGLPPIVLNISSHSLDIDRIMAVLASLPQKKKNAASSTGDTGQETDTLSQLLIQGQIDLTAVSYEKIELRDITFDYGLEKGVLTCKDLTTSTMGGEIRGEVKAVLLNPQTYKGKIGIHTLQLTDLQQSLSTTSRAGTMKGTLSSAFEFAGAGFSTARMESNLTANGELDMREIKLQGSEIGHSLAAILNLPELKDLNMETLTGHFTIRNGRLQLDTAMNSSLFSGRTSGSMGLDGSLNMPLTITLSPKLSANLEQRLNVAKYLEKRDKQTVVRLDVKGSLSKPKVTLNENYIRRQTTNSLVDHALGSDASAEEKAAGEAVKGVLDSLFGK